MNNSGKWKGRTHRSNSFSTDAGKGPRKFRKVVYNAFQQEDGNSTGGTNGVLSDGLDD